MIARLTGTIAECRPDHVLVDVHGVGYRLHIPLSTYYVLASAGSAPATLHVHTHVREDALQLYGFATAPERAVFEQLIAVSGVGPRLALAFLSGIGVDELRASVVGGDAARLQKIPGVGRKTAERVLVELRDKWGRRPPGAPEPPPAQGPEGADRAVVAVNLRTDAMSALVNLGYTADSARRAVDDALAGEADLNLESLLRRALGRLSR